MTGFDQCMTGHGPDSGHVPMRLGIWLPLEDLDRLESARSRVVGSLRGQLGDGEVDVLGTKNSFLDEQSAFESTESGLVIPEGDQGVAEVLEQSGHRGVIDAMGSFHVR
jgi:hypothetical protein